MLVFSRMDGCCPTMRTAPPWVPLPPSLTCCQQQRVPRLAHTRLHQAPAPRRGGTTSATTVAASAAVSSTAAAAAAPAWSRNQGPAAGHHIATGSGTTPSRTTGSGTTTSGIRRSASHPANEWILHLEAAGVLQARQYCTAFRCTAPRLPLLRSPATAASRRTAGLVLGGQSVAPELQLA